MSNEGLRELEHLVLLAISRLEPPAHGVPIVKELSDTVARSTSRASVYVVLRRLETKGLVRSTLGDPTPERGGRAKRFYTLTPLAVRSLKTAQRDFVRLWAGSRVLLWLLAVGLSAATLSAQAPARLNFTGTWLTTTDPNATDVSTASHLPNALLRITHDGDRFDPDRSWSNEFIKERHVCDGRKNTNGYSSVVEVTTCHWDPALGGTVVIEGSLGLAGAPSTGTLRQRYWIAADGLLHVERMRDVKIASVTTNGPKTLEQIYRRVAPSAGLIR